MKQFMVNVRFGCLISSIIDWFASFISKDRHEDEINGSISDEEVDRGLFEELICNPSESQLNSEPNFDVNFCKILQIKRVGARVLQDENDVIYTPISVKGSPDVYVKNYMKNGIEEEELLKVVMTLLPDNFHGMILEEDIRKQEKNGSYLIRFRDNKNDKGPAMEIDEEGEKKIDQGAAMEKGDEKKFDHCTAMIIENDYKEYFDPAGKVPLNLINFFTHYNSRQVQSSEYNTCAFHCTFYLVSRYKGYTMDHLSAFYTGNLEENDKMVTEKFTKIQAE